VFDEDRYWQITADYAKAAPDDVLIRITARNAGPDRKRVYVTNAVKGEEEKRSGYASFVNDLRSIERLLDYSPGETKSDIRAAG
jgi:hypothetical protein